MSDRIFSRGDRIDDRFELTQPLGKGAFGVVWKGLDHANDQAPIAVKILFEKYRRDRKMVGRFIQEAKILEKVQHVAIASPIAWSAEGDIAYLAMEFVDGETLDRRFEGNAREDSPVPKQGIAWICDQLCSAVGYAHDQDVVHRDMKPKNVMVNRRGTRPFLKVLDFGIAKMLVGSEIDPTTVGRVLGSVLYISPEAILSQKIDHRADVFSIGTIMFELITLRRAWARDEEGKPHPFHTPITGGEMNSHVAVLKRIARGERPKASSVRPEITREVDEVLRRAMAIDPKERYDSAAAFAVALRGALLDEPVPHADGPSTIIDNEGAVPQLAANEFDELATESEGHEIAAPAQVEATRSDRPPDSEPVTAEAPSPSLPAPVAEPVVRQREPSVHLEPRRSPAGMLLLIALFAAIGVGVLLATR